MGTRVGQGGGVGLHFGDSHRATGLPVARHEKHGLGRHLSTILKSRGGNAAHEPDSTVEVPAPVR